MRKAPIAELEALVRPSGYFRQKARNLKTFIAFLDQQYSGSLARMFSQPTEKLRAELLALNGVGPETADSILLYAGNHPVFVVDAYTRRVLERRHGIIRRVRNSGFKNSGVKTRRPAMKKFARWSNTPSAAPRRLLSRCESQAQTPGTTRRR